MWVLLWNFWGPVPRWYGIYGWRAEAPGPLPSLWARTLLETEDVQATHYEENQLKFRKESYWKTSNLWYIRSIHERPLNVKQRGPAVHGPLIHQNINLYALVYIVVSLTWLKLGQTHFIMYQFLYCHKHTHLFPPLQLLVLCNCTPHCNDKYLSDLTRYVLIK